MPACAKTCLRIVLIVLVFVAGTPAQTSDTATIQGHVSDSSHAPVVAVKITVTSTLTGASRTTQSDEDGNFAITSLPAGTAYRLSAAKEGFAPYVLNSLSPAAGTSTNVNLELDVASKHFQVTVAGVAGEVRTDAPQLGDRIVGQQLAETPMVDRRVTSCPCWIQPINRRSIKATSSRINSCSPPMALVAGRLRSRSMELPAMIAGVGNELFSSVPLAAVQEVAILTNAFSAEYGGSTGSAVNIITRTGGNRLAAS